MNRQGRDGRISGPAVRRLAVLGAIAAATAAFAAAAVFALAARSGVPELVPGGQRPPPRATRTRT